MNRRLALGLLAVTLLAASPAWARLRTYDLDTEFGPVNLTIDSTTGEVVGTYAKYSGKIYGHLTPNGRIDGLWVQPEADNSCVGERHGSHHWGYLTFDDPAGGALNGLWGYCDVDPRATWNGKVVR